MPTSPDNPVCNDSLFSLALNACVEAVLMRLLVTAGDLHTEAFDRHRRRVWELADRAGYLYADEPMPHLLDGDSETVDGWAQGVERRRKERQEADECVRRQAREVLIRAKNWAAFGLPAPEQLLVDLQRGESRLICGIGCFRTGTACASPILSVITASFSSAIRWT
ncbi:hypothetical protein G3O06_01280 [Burkholderia sp. Ac-20345]|uniref:hypothetical protein n=1 Tax=Burkholderia sp. Ac-20345 TaxID=2703891 RepID=UPI00197BD414|nr:hypothetical protein [Burkholderia sp. Ac-20345]MBN3776196.1 hypothetical protein [Burkholderia sp. Ac-20345]